MFEIFHVKDKFTSPSLTARLGKLTGKQYVGKIFIYLYHISCASINTFDRKAEIEELWCNLQKIHFGSYITKNSEFESMIVINQSCASF